MTPHPALWLKLDTRVIDGFDAALGDRVLRIDTRTVAVLRRLARHAGWPRAVATLFRAMVRPDWERTAPNLQRKRIRLPSVFGNPAVGRAYHWIKAVQARLLYDRIAADVAPGRAALIYNGGLYPESVLDRVARDHGLPHLYVEQGFFPGTLQIDPVGLNAANSVPRDPAFYRSSPDFAAQGLPQALTVRAAKRRGDRPVALTPGYVFVPFQVPSDTQITLHSPWIRDMTQFLSTIRAAADRHPDTTFVIKEHPSFPISVRGRFPPHPRVLFANGNPTHDLIDGARAVITLNSSVGIEALVLERPVILLGNACYDIDGLVLRARDDAGLDRALAARDARPDPELRRQVLGFLWAHYLMPGSYDDLPADLPDRLAARLAPPWLSQRRTD